MVGLDIGSKTIKIVELVKEGAGYRLRGSGIAGHKGETPEHSVDPKSDAALSEAIKKLHKAAKISSREINLALPEPSVFTRTIKFPPLTDAEIASAVKWEAEQYIPIPANEAIIQHAIIERNDKSTPPQTIVLLVAAPRVLVEKYVKVVQAAGLSVVGVETEAMAMARALSPAQGVALLVDFGAKSTDIAIAKNSSLCFSRTIPTAGEAFTRAVAQNLGIAYQQAEEYKRAYGLAGSELEGKVKSAIDPIFGVVTDEIKKAIHFYQTEEGGDAPSSVILSGGTAGMPQAISLLTQKLGLEVAIANPFAKIILDPAVAKSIAPYAPLYSIAIGLALREG
jgi:type IV pilus assembly protein PilM